MTVTIKKTILAGLLALLLPATLTMGRVLAAPTPPQAADSTSAPAVTDSSLVADSPDSAHFVTASLLVITPGPDIYTVFGHTALRMECPSKGLDYCFSFETQADAMGYLRFFAGQSWSGFLPIPTQEFLQQYREQGRGVTQYELNLTTHEKQELWRSLDNDMLEGAHRKFNLLQNNCVSMAVYKVESVLENEELVCKQWPAPMRLINGDILAWHSRRSPWGQFLFMAFLGAEADIFWEQEQRLSPECVIDILRHSVIRTEPRAADGTLTGAVRERPALIGQAKTILPLRTEYKASPVTPTIAFALLLILTLLVMLPLDQWLHHPSRAAQRVRRAYGGVLFTAQSAAGLFLLFVTLVAGLFGRHWNWLLIPLNPVPLLLWLCCRRRRWYRHVYVAYAAVLALFLAIVPWVTTQLLLPHYLLAATLLAACAGKALQKP